ncbi:hypothetical protein ABW19_dt0202045 [Dactylella cylindrospora]|nr:hypothetical protein ABW19_dt0202045 [Dactylella cylindrospora]
MSLQPGSYQIVSEDDTRNPFRRFIGRFIVEDLSLRPKPVYRLLPNVIPPRPWIVEAAGEGKYWLRALGAKTGVGQDSRVFAFLIDTYPPGPVEWEVVRVDYGGGYKIIGPGGRVWTIGDHSPVGDVITVEPDRGSDPKQIFHFFPAIQYNAQSSEDTYEPGHTHNRHGEGDPENQDMFGYSYGKRERKFCG